MECGQFKLGGMVVFVICNLIPKCFNMRLIRKHLLEVTINVSTFFFDQTTGIERVYFIKW